MFKRMTLLLMTFIVLISFSTAEAGSKYYFSMPEPQGSKGVTFEDDNIKMAFDMGEKPNKEGYPFKLVNKTNTVIRINWNDAALIARDGRSNRVGHCGVAYVDIAQGKQLQPAVIAPNSFISDIVFFSNSIELWGNQWINRDNLYPGKYSDAIKLVGTSRKLLLPLEINGKTIYYSFAIKVDKVEKD